MILGFDLHMCAQGNTQTQNEVYETKSMNEANTKENFFSLFIKN